MHEVAQTGEKILRYVEKSRTKMDMTLKENDDENQVIPDSGVMRTHCEENFTAEISDPT